VIVAIVIMMPHIPIINVAHGDLYRI